MGLEVRQAKYLAQAVAIYEKYDPARVDIVLHCDKLVRNHRHQEPTLIAKLEAKVFNSLAHLPSCTGSR
jgi:hypothetical protein